MKNRGGTFKCKLHKNVKQKNLMIILGGMREKRKVTTRLTPLSPTENFRRCQKNKNTKKRGVTIVFPIVKL